MTFFPLGTPNKAAAAGGIYLFLVANGWEQTLAKHKPQSQILLSTQAATTVGSCLDAVFGITTSRPTIERSATAFQKIVAYIFGLSDDKGKFDYRSGGRDNWIAKVHAVALKELLRPRFANGSDHFSLALARIH